MRSMLLAAVLLLPAVSLAEIFESPEQVRPVLPGMQAPAFRALDVDGEAIEVDPAELERPIVLTFYRGGWCPYCNMHLAELRTTEEELTEMGFEVWFISPDKPELLAEGKDSEFGYRLLSDPGMNAAQAFGIAFRLDDETFERYVGFGNNLNERSGDDHRALPARRRSSSAPTARSSSATSIPTTACGWRRVCCWPPRAPTARARTSG